MRIWEGAGVELEITFRDPDTAALFDPGEPVTVTLRDPGGAEEVITATRVVEGTYTASFVANESGQWTYRAESAGALPGVIEGRIKVDASTV